jgi:hypothetical protein
MRRVVLPVAIALVCVLGAAGVASVLVPAGRIHRVRPELFGLIDQALQRRIQEPGRAAGE